MRQCYGHTGDYFDYKCYKRLKDYYDKYYVSEDGMKFLADYKESSGDNQNIISKYEDIFKKLTNNLAGDGLMNYDKSITCTYNNYWLNKEVRKKNHKVDNNELFEIIKKYADKYSNEKHRNYYNSCEPYIHYIDSVKYQKMSKLYELYDLYSELDIYHNKLNYNLIHSTCVTLGNLTRKHNEIIKEYEDVEYAENIDNDLFEKIMKIKNLIKNLKLNFYEYCVYYKKLDLHTSKYEKQELEKKLAAQKQQELEKERAAQRQQELPRLEVTKEQASLSSSETIDPDSRQKEVYSEINVTQDRRRDDIVKGHHVDTIGNVELSATGYSRSSQGRETYDNNLAIQQEHNFDPSRFPVDSPLNSEKAISEEGIMGKIQSTLSGIVSEVEPAPILGVSGGMGVLFLLFKYTPVGSFLGGRRRRIHQIPSIFRGFPPGDFANFQEYDGGFIGYSPMGINPLAE